MNLTRSNVNYRGIMTFWQEVGFIELWQPEKFDNAQPQETVYSIYGKLFNDNAQPSEKIQSNGMGNFGFDDYIYPNETLYNYISGNDNITINEQSSKNQASNEIAHLTESIGINTPLTNSGQDASKPSEQITITNS